MEEHMDVSPENITTEDPQQSIMESEVSDGFCGDMDSQYINIRTTNYNINVEDKVNIFWKNLLEEHSLNKRDQQNETPKTNSCHSNKRKRSNSITNLSENNEELSKSISEDVNQIIIEVNQFDKKNELVALLKNTDDCQGIIVFVGLRRRADLFERFLCEIGFPTSAIHSERAKREREKSVMSFKTRKTKILMTTTMDKATLDTGVRLIMNMDLPDTIEEYIQRVEYAASLSPPPKVFSFFEPKTDKKIANSLIKILTLNNQPIPEFLLKYKIDGPEVEKGPNRRTKKKKFFY